MSDESSIVLQGLLGRMLQGDEGARQELIHCAYERLRCLARVILNESFPRLKVSPGLIQTTEVANEAALGMYQVLAEIRPATVRDFFRLAAQRIRWLLLDHAKRMDRARRQASENVPTDESYPPPFQDEFTPDLNLLYQKIEELPDQEREVVDLLYFHGLNHTETAVMLGVTDRTVRRYWTAARLKLLHSLKDLLPQAPGPFLGDQATDSTNTSEA